jgi:hypothetical protein
MPLSGIEFTAKTRRAGRSGRTTCSDEALHLDRLGRLLHLQVVCVTRFACLLVAFSGRSASGALADQVRQAVEARRAPDQTPISGNRASLGLSQWASHTTLARPSPPGGRIRAAILSRQERAWTATSFRAESLVARSRRRCALVAPEVDARALCGAIACGPEAAAYNSASIDWVAAGLLAIVRFLVFARARGLWSLRQAFRWVDLCASGFAMFGSLWPRSPKEWR